MKIDAKLSGSLHHLIIKDLTRPHAFAEERVGFVFGRMGSLADEGKVILLSRYHSIPDDQYVNDPSVGARIDRKAITWAMQAVYFARQTHEGIFHVHLHDLPGETTMSAVDSLEIPRLLPGFQAAGRDAAHGIVVFSRNHGSAWVWLPGHREPIVADSLSVIGAPIGVFKRMTAK
jgi:hypothetical protein